MSTCHETFLRAVAVYLSEPAAMPDVVARALHEQAERLLRDPADPCELAEVVLQMAEATGRMDEAEAAHARACKLHKAEWAELVQRIESQLPGGLQ